ncbi:hypothetical protein SARC_07866 [Sphaeroforma arctica JP610]|uniref:Kinase n=1 Tax=Sphaeroforma arctica JP610 TaxID=667725 RepID=A0A0L0FST4_9EUKA|nr:hypothetical protein SARC_07866 [Sphaeroforma arctica JP610]KNC79754.1 hypothetical protein SARC_07866 [Sphaeroforma arctica JP610]|eukprot:XP_014153656.1 hypothetical protein SARC_07866 [Sphaeroforma arctica JP610]
MYLGVKTEGDTDYLVMENSVYGFVRPCVMDLKMGTKTYGEDATPEKIAREEKKYPPQKTLGFRFVGMKVWQPATESYSKTEREWCMAIDETTVGAGLERFFDNGTDALRKDVVSDVRDQIEKIKLTLENHPFMRLYGSSLLVVYEGDPSASNKKPLVKMIDFAHPFPINDGGVDTGYILGCSTILTELERITH